MSSDKRSIKESIQRAGRKISRSPGRLRVATRSTAPKLSGTPGSVNSRALAAELESIMNLQAQDSRLLANSERDSSSREISTSEILPSAPTLIPTTNQEIIRSSDSHSEISTVSSVVRGPPRQNLQFATQIPLASPNFSRHLHPQLAADGLDIRVPIMTYLKVIPLSLALSSACIINLDDRDSKIKMKKIQECCDSSGLLSLLLNARRSPVPTPDNASGYSP